MTLNTEAQKTQRIKIISHTYCYKFRLLDKINSLITNYYLIMQKKILVLLLIISVSLVANAQRKVKYKDVYDLILTGNNEKSYSLLLEYQKQEPEFINTYFQLGLISFNWAKNYDPLTNIEMVEQFIYNTNLYFGLAKGKLQNDDRDVKKNKDYYMNVDILKQIDKIEYIDVNNFLTQKIEEIKKYDINAHLIADNFNQSIEHYNKCTQIYMEINKANSKIKDIYLEPSSDLNLKIEQIISSYDSAMYFFERYKSAIKNYPIKYYNQTLLIKQIETYRLDGLTNSNFLEPTILIWDYKTWAQNLKFVLEKNIENLRYEISTKNTELLTKENSLNSVKGYSDNYVGIAVDEKLSFKIEKYDYQSIITSLFNYRYSKIGLIVQTKQNFNNYLDTTTNLTNELRAKDYYQTLNLYKTTDSLLTILQNRTIDKNIKKYDVFFSAYYAGITGIKKYPETEAKNIKTLFTNSLDNLKKSTILDKKVFVSDTTLLKFNDAVFNVKIKTPDYKKDAAKKYYTTQITKNKTGEYCLAGYLQQSNGAQMFIAKADKNKTVTWYKTIPITYAYESASLLKPIENGFLLVSHSQNGNSHKNTIYKYDNIGSQTLKLDLAQNKIPQYIKYDDINENFIVAYKGLEYNKLESKSDTLIIEKINAISKLVEWKKEISLVGNIFDIIKTDTIYNIFCNFATYKDIDGTTKISSTGNKTSATNVLIMQITESGKLLKITPINSTNPFFGISASKIDSETINIVGLKTQEKNVSDIRIETTDEIYYQIINSKLKTIYSNL